MSKTGRSNYRRSGRERRHQAKLERRIYARTVRREHPDIRLLGKAFLALALADASRTADAKAEARAVVDTDAHTTGEEVHHDD